MNSYRQKKLPTVHLERLFISLRKVIHLKHIERIYIILIIYEYKTNKILFIKKIKSIKLNINMYLTHINTYMLLFTEKIMN